MSDETTGAPAGMEPAAGGTGAPTASVAEPAYDKGDYDARISNEPDFAVNEVKRLTSELTKAQQSTKAAERFLSMADAVAPGNRDAGVQILEDAIAKQSRIASEPRAKKVFDDWLNGGKLPDAMDADAQAASDDLFGQDIENSSVIRELRQELASLRGQTAQQSAQANLKEFFEGDEVGKALSTEERGEVLNQIMGSIQRAQSSGQSSLLNNLTSETVRTIAADWLTKSGKLGEVGERIARARAEAKNAAATGEPSPIGTGLPTGTNYDKMPLAKAVEAFAKENNVNLWEPKVR